MVLCQYMDSQPARSVPPTITATRPAGSKGRSRRNGPPWPRSGAPAAGTLVGAANGSRDAACRQSCPTSGTVMPDGNDGGKVIAPAGGTHVQASAPATMTAANPALTATQRMPGATVTPSSRHCAAAPDATV